MGKVVDGQRQNTLKKIQQKEHELKTLSLLKCVCIAHHLSSQDIVEKLQGFSCFGQSVADAYSVITLCGVALISTL